MGKIKKEQPSRRLKMQIYLKPYPYRTNCNIPSLPRSDDKGFFNIKKHPGLIKKVPELVEWPDLANCVEQINKNSIFATFGCDREIEPLQNLQLVWSFVNLYLPVISDNDGTEAEGRYNELIGNFLIKYARDTFGNTNIEFMLNPTNYHDLDKIKKGATPSEKTLLFVGWSLNIKTLGVGSTLEEARDLWKHGIERTTEFLVKY